MPIGKINTYAILFGKIDVVMLIGAKSSCNHCFIFIFTPNFLKIILT
jgi:hypothetical protein